MTHLNFGYNLDDFFDKDEKENQFYNSFFEQFDQAMPNGFILGLQSGQTLNYEFMLEMDSFSKQIEQLPEISELASITNLQAIQLSGGELISSNLLSLANEKEFKSTMQSLDSTPSHKFRFISRKGKSTYAYVLLKDSLPIDALLKLKKRIDFIASKYSFSKIFFIDLDYNNYLLVEKIKKDSTRLMLLALVIIFALLIFFFRSVKGVLIPIAIVIGTVIWILGTIAFFDVDMNALTIAIPVIVSVISLSDVIHIMNRYGEEKSGDSYSKIVATKKDVLQAIILTTLTTCIGFLSLSYSKIPVFQQFGGFTALGVVYALILAYFVLPIMLDRSGNIKESKVLTKITPKRIWGMPTVIVTAVFIVVCVLGIMRVHHNNYFYEDIHEDDEIGQSFLFIEKEMNGLRDLTIAVTLKDSTKSVFNATILQQLGQLENYIETHYDATIEMSLASYAKQINRSLNNGYAAHYCIPQDESSVNLIKGTIIKNAKALKIRSFVSRNKQATFIKTKTSDQGSYATFALNDSLYAYASSHFPDLNIAVTGKAHIIDMTNINVSEGMIWNLVIIVLFIFLMMSYVFKSFRLGFISLIPNILPLLAITAVVGWLDFGMNVATTIVYTIAFGIAVDDTIHFLARYKIEIGKGIENKQAIINALRTSGGAIMLTTIVLVAGFGVLITSHFYANYITGLLVCVGMITALACDLYLLPVILKLSERGK